MFQKDEKDRIYYVASHVGDLVEMVGCRVTAVHSGALGEREGIIAFVKHHQRANLWEVAFEGDVPTLNLKGGEWKSYEWRVLDDRITCVYCGTTRAHTFFQTPIGERLRRASVCFECDHWLNVVGGLWLDDPKLFAEGLGVPLIPTRFSHMLPMEVKPDV